MSENKINSKVSIASLLITLGIVYGDLCTSPLYTFKAIIGTNPITEQLVLGGVSCVFWTLTLQTTFKYVLLTLRADNEGEGGIFALYSLVRKYGKRIIVPTMIGAAALMADGIITPAVTVTTSIEGLKMIHGLEHLSPVPIVIIIISILFFTQRFGTEKIGKAFGPIMFIWLSLLLILGLSYIIKYPIVIRALSPHYAVNLLVNYPNAFWILGAVFLCTTGAEALYSDMGHCGKNNIKVSWIFVKISLVANYLGQAAWALHQDNTVLGSRNPFFEMMPHWFLLLGIIIATLASIVASQSLISGTFTLISEAININFWQRSNIKQPTEIKGQVYIPSANLLLWVGCIIVVLLFKTSSHMEAAYGLAITVTMLATTYLLTYFLHYKLKWNKFLVGLFLLVYCTIELSFFAANLSKFTHGAYISVLFGGCFFLVMYCSYFGSKLNDRYTKYLNIKDYAPKIVELSNDTSIPKFVTHLIYLTKSENVDLVEERIIQSIFSKKPKRADIYWLFHISRTNKPYSLNYEIAEIVDDKIIRIKLNIGFRIKARTEMSFLKIINDLIADKELAPELKEMGSTKYNPSVDFKFIIMERFLSVENEFSLKDGLVMNTYFLLKRYSQKDVDAFGIDKSSVIKEQTPMVFESIGNIHLSRKIIDPLN